MTIVTATAPVVAVCIKGRIIRFWPLSVAARAGSFLASLNKLSCGLVRPGSTLRVAPQKVAETPQQDAACSVCKKSCLTKPARDFFDHSYRTPGERLPPKKFNFELAARRKFFDGRLKTTAWCGEIFVTRLPTARPAPRRANPQAAEGMRLLSPSGGARPGGVVSLFFRTPALPRSRQAFAISP